MEAVKNLMAKDHSINLVDVRKYIRNFRDRFPIGFHGQVDMVYPYSESFNKQAVQRLLDQNGCVGLRIFSGLQDDGQVVFILMGFDVNGKNILKKVDINAKLIKTAHNSDGTVDGVTLEKGERNPPSQDDDSESLFG